MRAYMQIDRATRPIDRDRHDYWSMRWRRDDRYRSLILNSYWSIVYHRLIGPVSQFEPAASCTTLSSVYVDGGQRFASDGVNSRLPSSIIVSMLATLHHLRHAAAGSSQLGEIRRINCRAQPSNGDIGFPSRYLFVGTDTPGYRWDYRCRFLIHPAPSYSI